MERKRQFITSIEVDNKQLLITDPCYFLQNRGSITLIEEQEKQRDAEKPNFTLEVLFNEKEIYPGDFEDRIKVTEEDYPVEYRTLQWAKERLASYTSLDEEFTKQEEEHIIREYGYISELYNARRRAYDKKYAAWEYKWDKKDDYLYTIFGKELSLLDEFKNCNFITNDTGWGDWSNSVYIDKAWVGDFCADAGLTTIVELTEENKEYFTPFFAKQRGRFTNTVLPAFTGTVSAYWIVEGSDRFLYIEGIGNYNFNTDLFEEDEDE